MSKNYQNIDDLFRDKFVNFEPEPPAHIWDNVKSHIHSGGTSGSGFGNLLISLSAIIFALGVLSSFLLISDENTSQNALPSVALANSGDELNVEVKTSQARGETKVPVKKESLLITTDDQGEEKPIVAQGGDNKEKDKKSNKAERRNRNKRDGSVRIEPQMNSGVPHERMGKLSLLATSEVVSLPGSAGTKDQAKAGGSHSQLNQSSVHVGHIDNRNTTVDIVAATGNFNTSPSRNYGIKGEWTAGVYFTPYMTQYPSDNNLNNHGYSVDLLASWKKNRFIVQSGIGIAFTRDRGKQEVSYNEYLGSYEDVYNVTFDSINNELVATFHTVTTHVYDTVAQVKISQTQRLFTYLNIPVLFGYTQEFRRFGWFVKTGPSVSLMVHKNVPSIRIEDENYRLLAENSEMPDRIHTQWNYLLTAGITYKAGSRIDLSVEPVFRYHINPAYERNSISTRHPYSVGLRMGLQFNF